MSVQEHVAAHRRRHAVILCHPDGKSFDHAVAAAYCDTVRAAGQVAVLRDLYAMGVDPVLKADERPTIAHPRRSADVTVELDAIAGCDVFVLVYPIWFGSPPAMMKGYIERVLGTAVTPAAMRDQERTTLMGGKLLLSFTTSASTDIWLNAHGQEQVLRILDNYLVDAFGMQSQDHVRFDHITPTLSPHFANQYLREVAAQADRTCARIAAGNDVPGQIPVRRAVP